MLFGIADSADAMLINCTAYQEGRKLSDLPVEKIRDYLGKPDCFVWVSMEDAGPEELEKMRAEFGLHPLAVEDAQYGHQRPKIEEYGESLFAVIHMVEFVDGKLEVGELDIFLEKDYVLAIRNRSRTDLAEVRARCEREPELLKLGPAFVFYALIDEVVDRYLPVLDALGAELDALEEQIFTKGSQRASIQKMYQLKRKTTSLKHAVAPLMEAVAKLFGGRVPPLCVNTQEYFRDVYDHLYRLDASIEAMRDTITMAIQVNLSMAATDENEVTKRLAAWAAIFAVATAFFGLWGMNFRVMPELEWKYGYLAAVILVVGVCGYLYYRFRKSGWL